LIVRCSDASDVEPMLIHIREKGNKRLMQAACKQHQRCTEPSSSSSTSRHTAEHVQRTSFDDQKSLIELVPVPHPVLASEVEDSRPQKGEREMSLLI
jgi:hypothetical protein